MRRVVASSALVLVGGAAFATPAIDVDGVCPSITVTLSGATASRKVLLFTGDPSATTTLASGPCAGTVVDVAGANQPRHQLVTTRTDSDGGLVFHARECEQRRLREREPPRNRPHDVRDDGGHPVADRLLRTRRRPARLLAGQ